MTAADDEQVKHPLETMFDELIEDLRADGHTVTDLPPQPEGTLTVNFVPRRKREQDGGPTEGERGPRKI